VLFEGPSGVLASAPSYNLPIFHPSLRRVTWSNGAIATLYSADEPEVTCGTAEIGTGAYTMARAGAWSLASGQGGTRPSSQRSACRFANAARVPTNTCGGSTSPGRSCGPRRG
jgi:phage terminase large subunit-like protein